MVYKSIQEIARNYIDGVYENKMEYPNPHVNMFKITHVFDENESVKWNREQVEIKNMGIVNATNDYRSETNRLSKLLREDIVENLLYDYALNREQVEKLYDFAYGEKHSSMTDVFYYVEELADFFQVLADLKNK